MVKFNFLSLLSLLFICIFMSRLASLFPCVCLPKARVHFQHSAELLSRLVKVEANYSLQLYPDEGHTLRDPRSVQHFQRTVVNYLQSCLKHSVLLDPIEDDEEEDDWIQRSLAFFSKDSPRDCLPFYAFPWVWLPGTGAQERGTKLIRSPPASSGKIDVWYALLHTIISTVSLYVCLQKSRWMMWTKRLRNLPNVFDDFKNGCMEWISLHRLFCVSGLNPIRVKSAKSANGREHTRKKKNTNHWCSLKTYTLDEYILKMPFSIQSSGISWLSRWDHV